MQKPVLQSFLRRGVNTNQPADPTAATFVPAAADEPDHLLREFGKYAPARQAESTPAPVPDADDEGDDDGVYAVIRNTNYWFNRELAQIEQAARSEAASWAGNGLPHHATEASEALPVELALAARCTETFRQWMERVRVKMQDAIEHAGQLVSQRMVTLRFSLRQLENSQVELRDKERKLERLRGEVDAPTNFGYGRLLGRPQAIVLLALLACVEFAANFPVFRILLPMNAALVRVDQQIAERAVDKGFMTGWYHWFQDLMLRPEAFAVSLVVVIIIVVLSDSLGDSLRPLVALNVKEHPAAASGIRRHQAQHRTRLIGCIVGVALALTFLGIARQLVPATAIDRVRADSLSLVRADSALSVAIAAKSTSVGALSNARDDAEQTLAMRRDEAAYAKTVQSSNVPIILLNIALVFAAAVIGYSKKSDDLKDTLSEDPRISTLEVQISDLRQDALEQRQNVRQALTEVRGGISRVHHLRESRPLQEWRAKEERLRGVIPLFRSENARLRHLDPSEIRAFQREPEISFPDVEEPPYRAPTGLAGYEAEFADLVDEFGRLSREVSATTLGVVA